MRAPLLGTLKDIYKGKFEMVSSLLRGPVGEAVMGSFYLGL